MAYSTWSIRETIEKIRENQMYLPAIQRKFVWGHEKITKLFDSVMRGYPIGTFLFWEVGSEKMNDYIFYKFLQDYHERDAFNNDSAPRPETREKIIGVLDGQQRLSSMFVSLQGSYSYRSRYKRKNDSESFPRRHLYLNLQSNKVDLDDDREYEFSFLTSTEASLIDTTHLWFRASDVLNWKEDPEIDHYYDKLIERDLSSEVIQAIKDNSKEIKKSIRILHQRIVLESLINFFTVKADEIDEILNIFVRVNSSATQLSKSDLLFSTIVATWQEAREEVETLLQTLNEKGQGFVFDTDFIMRSSLFLTDLSVLFRVKEFKRENVEKIRRHWDEIRDALIRTIDLIVEFGFNKENLASSNAIIPIAYFLIKKGDLNSHSKSDLRKYLSHVLIQQTFGAQTDRVLTGLRDGLRQKVMDEFQLRDKRFVLKDFINNTTLPPGRRLFCKKEDLDEVLQLRKGPYTFAVLSLLYPHIKFSQVTFHQDHIHPAALFSEGALKKMIPESEKRKLFSELCDQLPNLQIMEGNENKKKSKRPFESWLRDEYPDVTEQHDFLRRNHISTNASVKFEDFLDFFENRKSILRTQLEKQLLIS